MSVIRTGYQRGCDGCNAIHHAVCGNPRRALSAARQDGWQRREVVVGYYEVDEREWQTGIDGAEVYRMTGKRVMRAERQRLDLCPDCLDRLDEDTLELKAVTA